MTKGRGSNERRQSGRQHRPKDKRDAQDNGAAKQFDLLRRSEEVEGKRRKKPEVASLVAEIEKARKRDAAKLKAKHKRREKWRAV